MNKSKMTVIFFTFLLLATAVSAYDYEKISASFSVGYNIIDSTIVKDSGDVARFNFTIYNKLPQIVFFEINAPKAPVNWDIYPEPLSDYVVKAYPNSTANVIVVAKSFDEVVGSYSLDVDVKLQGTDEKIDVPIVVGVVPYRTPPKGYVPDVELGASLSPTKIDPKEKAVLTVELKNRNRRDITELKIELNSRLIDKSAVVSLGPLEKKTVEFTLSFDPLERPIADELRVKASTFAFNNTYYWKKNINYEIIQYSTLLRDTAVNKKFLKTEYEYAFSNNGNVKINTTARVPVSFFKRPFTFTQPKATVVKENGKSYLSWQIVLNAEKEGVLDTKKVYVTENYRPLFFIIVLIIVCTLGYYTFRSPIVVIKTASDIKTREGGISALKVKIYVKNRSKHTLKSIRITDKIPNLAEIEKEFYIGTLKPVKIVRYTNKATAVTWELLSLEPFEERIITYQMRSKLSILGGFMLPTAVVRFLNKRGREAITRSNKLNLKI